jgi:glucokinase
MLLAGPGIGSIYRALCQINGHEVLPMSAEEITSHARNGTRPDCVDTVRLYSRILASFCTNLALTFGARGGIYLVGQIFRAVEPFLTDANFEDRFLEAGAMNQLVMDTPVSLLLVEDPGLYGAAFCTIN